MGELLDYIARMAPKIKERDKYAWSLGDDTCAAIKDLGIDTKPGRKVDPDTLTLGEFASQLNQPTARVSEWWKCADLYPDEVRPHNVRMYEELTWNHYNLARRKSGGVLENAIELLDSAAKLHLGYNAFKRWLNGELWEGYIDVEEMAEAAKPYAQRGQHIWATYRVGQEDK